MLYSYIKWTKCKMTAYGSRRSRFLVCNAGDWLHRSMHFRKP
jgi:hypothetical protein